MKALVAFRENFMSSDLLDEDDFASFDARRLRYQINWAWYEGTVFRNMHKFAQLYKTTYGLYRHIRNIYNPAFRIGQFWRSHLYGGPIIVEDGKAMKKGALPVATQNENLREPLARIFQWSNWTVKKNIYSLWGAVLGDVGIRVVDDPGSGKVYLRVLHPGTVRDVAMDHVGNVKGYTIEEERVDPRNTNKVVMYREIATREGENVHYQTFMDNALYKWNGEQSDWTVPYGFVPLIFVQHNDVGLGWGWGAFQDARQKMNEIEDLASKLDDWVRIAVHAPWLLSGVDDPTKQRLNASAAGVEATKAKRGNPEAGREEVRTLYAPPGASATALVSPLDIASTSTHILGLLKSLEQDHPEMTADIHDVTGAISGRAIRISRERAENMVQDVRATYDDGMKRALQMALAIGGWRGYEGFGGLSLESYKAGALDFSFAERPVFQKDPTDDLELDAMLWDTAAKAKLAGVDLITFLRRQGWDEEELTALQSTPEYKARVSAMDAAMKASQAATQNPPPAMPNRFQSTQVEQPNP